LFENDEEQECKYVSDVVEQNSDDKEKRMLEIYLKKDYFRNFKWANNNEEIVF